MNVTKRSKKVLVEFKESVSYYSEYTCPSCNVTFIGAQVGKNTLRFRCQCGQELIVEKA